MYEHQREMIYTHVYQNMNKRVMKRTCASVLCFSAIGVRYQNMTGFEKQNLIGFPRYGLRSR